MRKPDKLWNLSDYGQSKTKDALAKFFRGYLLESGVISSMFEKLLYRYISNPDNGIPREARANVRGNLPKAILGDKLSWASLCRGLRMMENDKADVYIVLHKGKKRTLKKISVDLGPVIENPIEMKNDISMQIDPDADVVEFIKRDSAK